MKIIRLDQTTRRKFLKRIAILISIVIFYPFVNMIRQKIWYLRKSQIPLNIGMNIPQGISFFDNVIVNREENEYRIFLARCSHLGCQINKVENNNLVCQCHGSRFSLDGEALQGPAKHNLVSLNFKLDLKKRIIIVEVPS